MAQPFTNETVAALKEEISHLKARIAQLEQQLADIQAKCQHIFSETPIMRKCVKCGYTESMYY
ncbi:coiled-coil domain-containing protein [Anoxybacteroides amylolyticum]|uniref:Uncharacterized protein n=1 Tax=Anoxybacteroides amylolyticum TaxID=294699 RepID=A0A161HYC2_9BACL|nr:hypothetical protein [Anoxybacillus amylolyticus]ANB60430.1 hypothetical protein GFC30_797 [Anoxybacillus amylolyticus]